MAVRGMTWLRIFAAAAIFAAGWAVNGWRLTAVLEQERTTFAQAQRNAKDAALKASERHRQQELKWIEELANANKNLQIAGKRNADVVAGLMRERDRLRNDINQFAAGAGRAAEDSVAACRADAATLGDVLADALQREEDVTAAAETHAASTRSLLDAWPK